MHYICKMKKYGFENKKYTLLNKNETFLHFNFSKEGHLSKALNGFDISISLDVVDVVVVSNNLDD